MNTETQFQEVLDRLLEGIQVHDFNWRYVYVNDALVRYSGSSREELIGISLLEKYPGIEHSPLFQVLERCMQLRVAEKLESEFVFPNGNRAFFEMSIQPVPEGLSILSIDRTEQKKAEAKLLKSNRLYAFISAINQSIVHFEESQALLDHTCQVAVSTGQFKMAWVNMLDQAENLQVVSVQGITEIMQAAKASSGLSSTDPRLQQTPTGRVLSTGKYVVSNNLHTDPAMTSWRELMSKHDVRSMISLPIKKFGKVIGCFGFLSGVEDFFDDQEVALLTEATNDISFALENFDKAKRHKETEELVEKNEARFRALIEKSTDMKTLATRDGRYIYCSPSVTAILGHTQKELINSSLFDLIHPDDMEAFRKQRQILLLTPGESLPFEYRTRHKNGSYIWCEGIVTNLLHEPNLMAMVSNFRDISERKMAEQQREFDRNNMDALINSTHDLMWSVDKDHCLITSNIAFQEAIHQSGRTIRKGENVLERALTKEQAESFRFNYQRAFYGESFIVTEHSKAPADHWMEISFEPVRKGTDIIGVACYSRDITTKKKNEEEILRSNIELQKTNAELDRFVYSTSHDLRSPLTSILGLVQFIERESKEVDTLEYARMIRESINRLDAFIKNILSYSRNNRSMLESIPVPVTETVNAVINSLRHMPAAEGINFEIDIDEQQSFYSDAQRFTVIIENLVSNAIKFKDPDLTDQYIKVRGYVEEAQLQLRVEDNGIGIAAEYHEKIFAMFFRLSSQGAGTGIGLYIVRETVDKLGGKIRVDSVPGQGTMFTLTLKNSPPSRR